MVSDSKWIENNHIQIPPFELTWNHLVFALKGVADEVVGNGSMSVGCI